MSPGLELTPRIFDALIFGIERHGPSKRYPRGHERKNGGPYITHPVRVAQRVSQIGLPPGASREDAVIAAILHDTVEDTETTREDIASRFGEAVASLVMELTQDMSLPKEQRRRKMVEHSGEMSPVARAIKLCDRADNLRDLDWADEKFKVRYCEEAREMLARMAGSAPEVEAEIRGLIARHESAR